MKKIRILSVLCLIFFACNNGTNDDEREGSANLSSSSKRTISSSSKLTSSSSSEGGSSSSEVVYYPCKPFLSKDTLYFNKQGGIDTVDIGSPSILFEDFETLGQSYRDKKHDYKDLAQCKFSLTDHYIYTENEWHIKVESDYCKTNYCFNDRDGSYHSSHHHVPIMKMECSWFSITHISENYVQVSVSKNETGKERSQYIPLTGGGCALGIIGNIIIIQTSAP